MALGKCLRCDKVEEMTEDHIIPQWFNKALLNFEMKKLQDPRSEYVCKTCNGNKGGKIPYDREQARETMKKFVTAIAEEIRKHEPFTP